LTGWVRINTVKKVISRVSTGLENPGKSLNWKNKIPGLESPGINFLNLQLCQH
jgi:hypothetical protein